MIDDVHRIDELPQAVRIAVTTAAKAYVNRWLGGEPNTALRLATNELVQLLVNVYTLPERTPAPSDNPDKER